MKPSPLSLVEKSKGETAFGRLLHFWRKVCGLSQEQLSGPLGVSTRHISFLETGRSKPSRIVVQTLADIFGLSARDRAYLFASAGFASDQSLFDCPELSVWVRKSMRTALERSEPSPAFVHDSYGRLLAVNCAWLAFFLPRVDGALLEQDANIYELMMNPRGLHPLLQNGKALASGLALYITMETLQGDDVEGWEKLAKRLVHTSDYPVVLATDSGTVDLTVYNDTLSSSSQLIQPRLLIGRIYRDDGEPLLGAAELAAVPAEHPLLFRNL